MRRFLSHLCHTTEDEQGDLADGNVITKGHDGMTEFMQQDRGEQEKRGHPAHPPIPRF
jgi:hypothetical protein